MNIFIRFAFFILIFSCCNTERKDVLQEAHAPKALQDNSYDIKLSRTAKDDLVESLYQEMLENNKDLNALEEQIHKVQQDRVDSSASFESYDNKNHLYYENASSHLASIRDSIVRNKIKNILEQSQGKYEKQISRHRELALLLDQKNNTLNDLHTVLKIILTLNTIEKFQKEHLPSPKPMEQTIKEFDSVIKKTAGMSEKPMKENYNTEKGK